MKSIYAAIAGAGLMGLCCLPALAGPVSKADAAEAAEAIGVLAQDTSDPFYDGSYFKVSVAESAPCTLTKRLVDFNKDGTSAS